MMFVCWHCIPEKSRRKSLLLIRTPLGSGCADIQTSDMQNIDIDWDVEGIISAPSSVQGMLKVISSKTKSDSGTFWCWDGRVSTSFVIPQQSVQAKVSNHSTDSFLVQEHPW